MTEKAVRESLDRLVQAIHSAIDEVSKEGTLQPHYLRYVRLKATKFEYDNTGIKVDRQGVEFLKPIWRTNDVFQKLVKQDIYENIYKEMAEHYKLSDGQTNDYLHQLITNLASRILERKLKSAADTNKYLDSFVRDLNGEQQEFQVAVQLKAVILEPRFIELSDDVRLRKPERKDFEEEKIIYSDLSRGAQGDPTGFLNIVVHSNGGTSSWTVRNEIDGAIAVLRLYRLGAVECLGYTTETNSLLGISGTRETTPKLWGRRNYLITRKDVRSLKKFWANMKKVKLPDSAYSLSQEKETTEISIAYERYCDSLEGRMVEKCVSSAVMGLEALYLGDGEQQEMSYRLRMRASKILGLIGYNTNEVSERLKDAYEIRSKYVHGGLLNHKEKQKIEKKYGNINEFPKLIMDYLRASIVALLKRPGKTAFIKKIDDSFLDAKEAAEIKKLIFTP